MLPDVRTGPARHRRADEEPRAADDRGPRPPRTRSGTILLPPWTRAPWLGLRQPAVLLAVIGAAAILACASASAALFLSSSASKSLQRQIAAQCPDAAFPGFFSTTSQFPGFVSPPAASRTSLTTVDHDVSRAMGRAGLPGPRTFRWYAGTVTGPRRITQPINLVYSQQAAANLPQLKRIPGQGVLISDRAMEETGLRLGSVGTFAGNRVRVVGTYRDLIRTSVPSYWCSWKPRFEPPSADSSAPVPELTIATSPAVWLTAAQDGESSSYWLAPISPRGITVTKARRINSQQHQVFRRLAGSTPVTVAHLAGTDNQNKLPTMTRRSELIRAGLRGPVLPIALGGSILALLLVGAAGSYWADRRAREVRLLSSRGVGPLALAAKAAFELTLPAVIGSILGWGLSIELVRSIGPSPDLDAHAPLIAAGTAAIGLGAGIVLLSLVAGLRARNATERSVGHQASWAATVPWELAILGAAALLFLRLRTEPGVRVVNGVAQVNLLLVSFPLLFLLGAAVFCVRVLAGGLPAIRRTSARWPVAAYFAIRRITGARLVSVTLLAAASLPVAVVVYSGATTDTTRTTVEAKAAIYAGANTAVMTTYTPTRTPALRRLGVSVVTRYIGGTLGADDADLLAVDPRTFARAAYWDGRFADRSLPELMAALRARRADGRLPAIVIRYKPGSARDLALGHSRRRLAILGGVRYFPGLRDPYSDLIVVDRARLGSIDQYVDSQGETWSSGQGAATIDRIEEATHGQHLITQFVATPKTVTTTTNYLAVSWTFGYLEALAALVGLIAIGGLLLYLATRQRSRTASYAMGRRMGLTRGPHLRSLVIELGVLLGAAYGLGAALGWLSVLFVYRRLDVDATSPPAPLLTVPVAAFVGAAVVMAVVAVLAALVAQRAADAANPAEVLRVDA